MKKMTLVLILICVLPFQYGGCFGGGGGPDPGMLRINVDPVRFEGLTALSLNVIRLEVIITPDLTMEGHILTLSTEPRTLNLIGFSGLTPKLFDTNTVPEEGFILQIRFIVEDGSASRGPVTEPVTIPSSPQTGLKVISADQVVEIRDGSTTDVTFSIDPEKSVIENLGKGLLLKPVTKLEVGAVSSFPFNKFLPDRITVLFKNDATEAEINDTINSLGANVIFKNPYIPYYVLQLPAGSDVLAVQSTLNSLSIVQLALPDFLAVTEQQVRPNDRQFGQQWGLDNTGQFNGGTVTNIDIDAPEAWSLTTGSSNVIVAVIDTGINRNHLDLNANISVNVLERFGAPGVDDDLNGFVDDIYGWNFADNNNNTLDDINTFCSLNGQNPGGHGTLVAGTIGAVGNNSLFVTGVNWNVRIMPLRVAGTDGCISTSAIFNALTYAWQNGASIANISIGGATSFDQGFFLENLFFQAVGPLLVTVASGNEGVNVDADPSFFFFTEISHPQLIAVGAITDTGTIASFSNVGSISVDLGAPGTMILSTDRNGLTSFTQGTSFSSPFTAGVAALIKAQFPTLDPFSLRNRILNNVDVDSRYKSFATRGRLNAHRAVQ